MNRQIDSKTTEHAQIDVLAHPAQQELERLRIALNSLDDVTFFVDTEFRFTGIYGRLLDQYNHTPEQVVGKTVTEVYGPELGEDMIRHGQRALQGEVVMQEWVLPDPNSPRNVQTILNPLYDRDGRICGLVGASRDITEIRSKERELHENAINLESAVELAQLGQWRVDLINRKVKWSKELFEIIGRDPSLGQPPLRDYLKYISRLEFNRIRKIFVEAIDRDVPVEVTLTAIDESGRQRKLVLRGQVERDALANPVEIHGVAQDLTEIYETQEALRRSENNLKSLFHNSADAILIVLNREIIDINPAGLNLFRVKKADLVGKTTHVLHLSLESYEAYSDLIDPVIESGESSRTEWTFKRGDGTPVEVESLATRLPDGRVMAIMRDITSRKQAERKLRESEENFRRLFEHMREIAALHELVLDENGTPVNYRILDVNPSFEKNLGLDRERVLGKLATEAFGVAHPPYLRQYTMVALTGQASNFNSHFEPMDRDFSISICPLGPGRFATISWDVTEQTRFVKEIQQNQQLLRDAQRIGRLGNWTFYLVPEERMEFSEEMFRIYGIDPEQGPPSAEGVYNFVHPDDRALYHRKLMEQRHRKSDKFVFEYRLVTPAGETKHVRHISTPVFDKGGNLTAVFGTLQDITEQVQSFQRLRESEEALLTAQRIAHLGNWSISEDSSNPAFSEEFFNIFEVDPGSPPLEIDSFLEIVHPEDRDRLTHSLAEQMNEDDDTVLEYRLVMPDGRVKHIRHTFRVERQGPNGQRRFYGTVQDITSQRRAEEERHRFEIQMQHAQKLESLGVLAGGIAHDFNNILMTILGNADLALSDITSSSPVRRNLEDILSAAKQASDLTKQMLAYSGKGRFQVAVLNLSELVNEMSHMLEVSIHKNVRLNLDLDPSLPPVRADVGQIRQIVMNLIVNASDAIGDQPGAISIRTWTDIFSSDQLNGGYLDEALPDGRYAVLEVVDTGSGMNVNTLQKLFDPFFTTKFTGRGLGLAAVLGIVRGHHGDIVVTSQPGVGTTFKVFLPITEEKPVQEDSASDETTVLKGGGRVLVVDDEDTVRMVARRMLERLGFDVVEADNGRKALELLHQSPDGYTCVLLDLTMPELDGDGTLRLMEKEDLAVPVLLTSGYSEAEIVERFRGRAIAGVVEKPYQLDTLRRVLGSVISASA